jgi:hypothetical protein
VYRYDALGADRFQELCAALVGAEFADTRAYPTGQKDGGRDVTAEGGRIVFQARYTSNRPPNLVTWVERQVKKESKNFATLRAAGCNSWRLVTNISATAAARRGEMDRVSNRLESLGNDHGLDLGVVWKSDLDAWVRRSPQGIRLAFPEMLVGAEALVALFSADDLLQRERERRDLISDYVSSCWARDSQIKFSQVKLQSNSLARLFIDISAKRMPSTTQSSPGRGFASDEPDLAKYLLASGKSLVLIEGTPGQGKSTVVQYVAQAHRAAIRSPKQSEQDQTDLPALSPKSARVPVRIELAEYAYWMSGGDPWGPDPAPTSGTARKKASVEAYLAGHFANAVPAQTITISVIRDLLSGVATLIIFDGLDEVANIETRRRVVHEIDAFLSRFSDVETADVQTIVTTRPDASGLPLPGHLNAEKFTLSPLTSEQRKRLMRRWAAAQDLPAKDRRSLERIFHAASAAPHVVQLADNPMQLNLLLYLIRSKGEALPDRRTDLYRDYMSLYFDREVEKSEIVREHRPDIEESVAYTGWYLHGTAEVEPSSTRLEAARIIRIVKRYLSSVGRSDVPVEDVFKAMKDRVWVLTSKVTGTYEFDIQSIQEFCAARFLWEFADASSGYTPEQAVRELIDTPFWTNVTRFLAGHFPNREVPALATSLLERLDEHPGLRQASSTCWLLVSDAVFARQPKAEEPLAWRLTDDVPLRLVGSLDMAVTAFVDPQGAGRVMSQRLNEKISADHTSPLNPLRARSSAAVGGTDQFRTWWNGEIQDTTDPAKLQHLLALGTASDVGREVSSSTADRLPITVENSAAAAMCGITPSDDSDVSVTMLDAALDGHLTGLTLNGASHAADLLRVVDPIMFRDFVEGAGIPSNKERSAALKRLRARHPEHAETLQHAIRVNKSQGGNTSRWVNTSIALTRMFGRSTWIASEIAIIGASAPPERFRVGGDQMPGHPLLGEGMDFGSWVPEIRSNRDKANWWQSRVSDCNNDHARATWLLSVLAVADSSVVEEISDAVRRLTRQLSRTALNALLGSAERVGAQGWVRRLQLHDVDVWEPSSRLLVSHFVDKPLSVLGQDPADLLEMTSLQGSATAVSALNLLAFADPSPDLLAAVATLGVRDSGPLPDGRIPEEVAERIMTGELLLNDRWLLRAEEQVTAAEDRQAFRTLADVRWQLS